MFYPIEYKIMYDYFNDIYDKIKDSKVYYMKVGGYPNYMSNNPNKSILENFKNNLLDDISSPKDKLFLVKTAKPHSMYECMIYNLETEIKPGITNLSAKSQKVIFQTCYSFIKFLSISKIKDKYGLKNGSMYMVSNYDPDTLDRESGMSQKNFHLHLNFWTSDELLYMDSKKIGELSLLERVKAVDPMIPLGELILYDIFKDKLYGEPQNPDLDRDLLSNRPFGLKLKYDSWDEINTDKFRLEICNIHNTIKHYYSHLESIFFENIPEDRFWNRGNLKNIDVITLGINNTNLSRRSKDGLIKFAKNLKKFNSCDYESFKNNKEFRILNMPMAGLNYSIGFYSPYLNDINYLDSKYSSFYIVLQTKMYSPVGGAGTPKIVGYPNIFLERNAYPCSKEVVAKKMNFQRDFINFRKTGGY